MRNSDKILVGLAGAVILLFAAVMLITVMDSGDNPPRIRNITTTDTSGSYVPTTRAATSSPRLTPVETGGEKATWINIPTKGTEMDNTGTIRGKVTDTEGNPLVFAKVHITFPPRLPLNRNHNFTSHDGGYILSGLPPNKGYAIEATKSGYSKVFKDGIKVFAGSETTDVDFQLPKGGMVVVTVTNTSEKPVEGAKVQLFRQDRVANIEGGKQVKYFNVPTDANGKAIIDSLPPAEYRVRATHPACLAQPEDEKIVTVNSSEEVSVNIRLTLGSSLSGTVKDESGKPLPDVRVVIKPSDPSPGSSRNRIKNSRTGNKGEFVLMGLESGDYIITAYRNGYVDASETVSLGAGTETGNIELELGTGATISGRVVDADGTPIKGARLHSHGASYAYAISDANGDFTLKGLKDGTYALSAMAQGYLPANKIEGIAPGSSGVVVILYKPANVKGVLVLPSGVKTAMVRLDAATRDGGARPVQKTVRPSATGEFDIRFVKPGEYNAYAIHKDYRKGPLVKITLRSGENYTGLQLSLGPPK